MQVPRDDREQDRVLVDAFLADRGDAAFRRLYRCHNPRMLRLARALAQGSPPSAEDIVQEAWIRAVGGLAGFEGRASLASWLGGIVVNVARELRRRAAARIPDASAAAGEIERADPGDPTNLLSLAALLQELPEGFRNVFLLHDLDGFTHAEIGELLGIDAGTSKSQLARARQRLRDGLADETQTHGKDGHATPAL